MVQLGSIVGVLALSFVVVQAAPIQNEVAGLIRAQSLSELKHEAFVPMQKLGQNGMPVMNSNPAPVVAAAAGADPASEGHRAISAAAIDMPFRPIMVVPLPSSMTQQQQQQQQNQRLSAAFNNNNNNAKMGGDNDDTQSMAAVVSGSSSSNSHKLVGMDDQGLIKTVQLPATMVASAAAPLATPSVVIKNRKHLVGMDDMGKIQTLAVPMTVIGGGNDAADAATASVAAPSAASSVIASMPKYL